MHIDYLNLQSNQENINLYLNNNTKKGDSTFTLLIGENGVHKTTLLTYIYKLFSGKYIDKGIKMKIKYTVENQEYSVNTIFKNDNCHSVIVDSFSRIDKMDKVNFDWNRRFRVNDALVREFINTMVVASIDSHQKYEEIKGIFDYIGVNSNDLILSYRRGSRKSDHLYSKYLSDDKFILELNSLYRDLLKDSSFQNLYGEVNYRASSFLDNKDYDEMDSLRKIKAIEQYVSFLFDQSDIVTSSNNIYTLIPLSSFIKYEKKSQILKKIIIFFKEHLRSDFFNNIYIGDKSFPLIGLSTGEISLLLRLFNIINQIEPNSIVLIDEPELHLHPNWCINYISKLKQLFNKYDSHFIIATHSPLLVANLNKEDIVVLKKVGKEIINSNIDTGTFSVNIDTVLEQVFGVTLRDSEIISTIFQDIEKNFNSTITKKQLDAVEELKNLPQSSEKFRVFKKYYEKIKELDNGL